MKRNVFFISDGTGITSETLGHALLSQFDTLNYDQITIPFTNTLSKLSDAVVKINKVGVSAGIQPIVFSTLTNPELAKLLEKKCHALILDLFSAFIQPIESELDQKSSHITGRSHSLFDRASYDTRMDAVNFSLHNDDGSSIKQLPQAEVIIIGVSRSGKTPTSVYLAMQFGIRAANSPLNDDDLDAASLPKYIQPFRHRIYALTIDPERLHQIRQQRRPNSRYASLAQCRKEVQSAEEIFQVEHLPFLSTTKHSIEEIASQIIQDMGLKRRLY